MEVHTHTPTPRNKWTHYFWEFLMLFLVVFCGFLAEYQLEHKIEKDREKQYVKSLLEDLHEDTTVLTTSINELDGHLSRNDTLIKYLSGADANLNIASRVYPFELTQGTYDQIKSSGALRYFPQNLVNKLNAYDVQAKKILKREDIDIKVMLEQFFPLIQVFLNVEVATDIREALPITHEIYYAKTDIPTLRVIINLLSSLKTIRIRAMIEYEQMLKMAKELLGELKDRYHLE